MGLPLRTKTGKNIKRATAAQFIFLQELCPTTEVLISFLVLTCVKTTIFVLKEWKSRQMSLIVSRRVFVV